MRVLVKCSVCGQMTHVVTETTIAKLLTQKYACGHLNIVNVKGMAQAKQTLVTSESGKTLMNFQEQGVHALELANGRAVLNYEMGLGKTPTSLAFTALHKEDCWPCLVVCKSKLIRQWFSEILDWTGQVGNIFDMGGDDFDPDLNKMFKYHIMSADLLTTFEEKGVLAKMVPTLKTVILDECQMFKNLGAQRTQAVQRIVTSGVPHVLALSGTPIKNNAAEFFAVLNMIRPDLFFRYSDFVEDWVETVNSVSGRGVKLGGIKEWKLPLWKEKTKTFIIRATREEVMPDLPKKQRNFLYADLGEDIQDAYVEAMAEFNDAYKQALDAGEEVSIADTGNIMAKMSKLRRLTGISKVEPAIDFIEEFLTSNDRPLTIFYHHIDVANILMMRLRALCTKLGINPPIQFAPDVGKAAMDNMVNSCARNYWPTAHPEKDRVFVVSTLSGGEGLNLQKCQDAIMLERQWNPANEEQAEDRFPRIGSEASSIQITYLVALSSIDEIFHKLVEQKRAAVSSTLSGQYVRWEQSSLVKELADALYTAGAKQFSINGRIKGKKRRKK